MEPRPAHAVLKSRSFQPTLSQGQGSRPTIGAVLLGRPPRPFLNGESWAFGICHAPMTDGRFSALARHVSGDCTVEIRLSVGVASQS